jgi:hypothetical protein
MNISHITREIIITLFKQKYQYLYIKNTTNVYKLYKNNIIEHNITREILEMLQNVMNVILKRAN